MTEPSPGVLVALYGPTSAGKTRFAVELAGRVADALGAEPVVVSADSRQVYRYMDIGTSKTRPEEMRGVRHELLDVTEPTAKLELERWVALARDRVAGCLRSGGVPIVVGGTGIYLGALLQDWQTDGTAAARETLRREFPRSASREAHGMLRRLDPGAAARVHPHNHDGVLNVLAAALAGAGGPAAGSRPDDPIAAARPVVLGLDPGPRVLDERVARTYDDQVRRGLPAEVRGLDDRYGLDEQWRRYGPDSRNQVLHTHGYREFFELAAARRRSVSTLDASALAEVRAPVLAHVRAYTRRQRGWFGRLPGLTMVRSPARALPLVRAAAGRPRPG